MGGDVRASRLIIDIDELVHSEHAHDFVGRDYDVPFSIILVHAGPRNGPKLHRHPYPEVFVVQAGQATFQLGDEQAVVEAGHIVVGPSNVPHGFVNSGSDELRIVAIHGAAEFVTEWLSGPDGVWVSRPRR